MDNGYLKRNNLEIRFALEFLEITVGPVTFNRHTLRGVECVGMWVLVDSQPSDFDKDGERYTQRMTGACDWKVGPANRVSVNSDDVEEAVCTVC